MGAPPGQQQQHEHAVASPDNNGFGLSSSTPNGGGVLGDGVGGPPRLRFAMVCASNQNRSMEAHAMLKQHGYVVESYGVGARVKLPGPNAREPNVYSFGTPYETIYNDLMRKDPELYERNGLLRMVKRNMGVKRAPERWQESRRVHDVVVTFEQRVMEAVEESMPTRPVVEVCPCLVVNLEVKDSHEEAAVAAPQALRLAQALEQMAVTANGDWAAGLEELLDRFQQETGRRPLYTVCWA